MKKQLLKSLFICCYLTTMVAIGSNNLISNPIENRENSQQTTEDTRPKYRIGFDAPQINHRQLLLTIDENTTDGVDWGYDGRIPQIIADDMYWLIDEGKYVIQATNTVSIGKELSLVVVTTNGGAITIKIDTLEFPVSGLVVALKDKTLNTIKNLEEGAYEVTLPAGEYNNRFSIIFLKREEVLITPPPGEDETDTTGETTETDDDSNATEDENEEDLDENDDFNHHNHFNKNKLHIYVNNGQKVLNIKNKYALKLQKVMIFDCYGKQQYNWKDNLEAENISLPIQLKKGFYFVVVQTQKGPIFKRVMVQNS
jgi:hypothetical protein